MRSALWLVFDNSGSQCRENVSQKVLRYF